MGILKERPELLIGLLIMGLVILYYFPNFSLFFTHDDFFHFTIAQISDVKDIISFFNPLQPPQGWPYYRPLTTQVFYAVGKYVFNLDPLPMRIVNVFIFGLVLYLVKKIIFQWSRNRQLAWLATLFYTVSASHFVKIYFLGTQEIGLAFWSLLTIFIFNKYLILNKDRYLKLTWVSFLITLTTKETAVMLPGALFLTYIILKFQNFTSIKGVRILTKLLPFFIIDLIYVYLHVYHYGVPKGDSYVYVLSPRVLNTLFWYGVWSLNLPETLVDFVGPGFHFLPNLFKYFDHFIIPIFVSFGVFLVALVVGMLGLFIELRRGFKKDLMLLLWGFTWFVLWLVPVLSLPWHKFTIYLTLPMVGVAVGLAVIVNELVKKENLMFKGLGFGIVVSFFITSALTVRLTYKTHWVVQGAKTAKRVHEYMQKQLIKHPDAKLIVFYDSPEDKTLPWRPSRVLKTVLSDNNYFKVFYKNKIKAVYSSHEPSKIKTGVIYVKGRVFLGY